VDQVRLRRPASAPRRAPGEPSARRPLLYSLILLAVLVVFCAATRWGRTYPTFAHKTWILLRSAGSVSAEDRRVQAYDETYPVLLYIKDTTPPETVMLFPPGKLIDEQTPGDIPLLASATSIYSFIYPRVPVMWGDSSPWRERIDHILVWNHWGLDLVQPGAPKTEENNITIFPWKGRPPSW
jgi:hypothetical protein